MKIKRILISVLMTVISVQGAEIVDGVEMLPSAFDGKTPVVVETEEFRFVINPDATARSLVLKATGEECLAPEAGLPVFASLQKRPFNNETRLVQMAKRTMYPEARQVAAHARRCAFRNRPRHHERRGGDCRRCGQGRAPGADCRDGG